MKPLIGKDVLIVSRYFLRLGILAIQHKRADVGDLAVSFSGADSYAPLRRTSLFFFAAVHIVLGQVQRWSTASLAKVPRRAREAACLFPSH
jgi:hypothetical protein